MALLLPLGRSESAIIPLWYLCGYWLLWQLLPVVLYLPWLPTAWRQLTTWPAGDFPPPLPEMVQTTAVTLLLGLSWPYQQQSGMGLVVMMFVLILPALFHILGMAWVAKFRPWLLLLLSLVSVAGAVDLIYF
jgi:hypothetical protein